MPAEVAARRGALRASGLFAGACALLLSSSACGRASERTSRGSGAERPRAEEAPAVIAVEAAAPKAAALARLGPDFELACKALAKACDVRTEPCQAALFQLAECVSGQRGSRPPVRWISGEEARRQRRELRSRASNERSALEPALQVLGLGQRLEQDALEGHSQDAASQEKRGVSAAAHYSPRERAVFFVADDAAAHADEGASLTLVHEFVHALQDTTGELLRAQTALPDATFDRALSTWSDFEGEATFYEEVARALVQNREPRTWVLPRLGARTSGSDAAVVRQRRPLEASFATFPYTYGAYWAALNAQRPLSTYQILAARHEWPTPGVQRCDDDNPPRLGPDYPRRARDTLGAWLVALYVRRRSGDAERARAAAARWRGDFVSVYSRAPGAAATILWQTCWDSPKTALEMGELVEAQLHESYGERASVTVGAQRVRAFVRASTTDPLAPALPMPNPGPGGNAGHYSPFP